MMTEEELECIRAELLNRKALTVDAVATRQINKLFDELVLKARQNTS